LVGEEGKLHVYVYIMIGVVIIVTGMRTSFPL